MRLSVRRLTSSVFDERDIIYYMKAIFFSALYLLILFSVSEFIFNPAYLYYEIVWLDVPMHIFGGFGVASLTWAILRYKKIEVSYIKLVTVYLLVAVFWELYEYIHDLMIMREWNGWVDTASDIINGGIGMSSLYLFVRKK